MNAGPRLALIAIVVVSVCAASIGAASAATSARTCKTVTVVTRVHHRTVQRRERVCESAKISAAPTSLPYSGSTVRFGLTARGATTCALSASPALWSGRNPAPVKCTGGYSVVVPATNAARHWTVRFLVKNRYHQTVTVSQTLSQQANPIPIYGSENWSGYALQGSALNGAQGTFNVPNLSATPGESDVSEWVGVDGFTNTDAIQAGVHEIYDPVGNDEIVYPWWEILPAPETQIPSMTVRPGDSVSVQVRQVAGTLWQIAVLDNTTSQSFTTDQPYTGPETSAEWIVEAPSINGTPATLGVYSPAITFTGLAAAGNRVRLNELVLVQNGAIVSSPSALDANGFSVAYGSTPPPAP